MFGRSWPHKERTSSTISTERVHTTYKYMEEHLKAVKGKLSMQLQGVSLSDLPWGRFEDGPATFEASSNRIYLPGFRQLQPLVGNEVLIKQNTNV